MQHSLLKGFYLQDLLIEPASGRVSGPGFETHLKPKAVEVLLYLAARPLELVTRDELLQAVWGENTGTSDALTHAVSELRSCCKDHANSPSLIQTVPRRGYRLLQQPRPMDEPEPVSETGVFQAPDDGSFIGKLMRRGVVQAGAAYLVFSWLLIQVADIVSPTLNLPAWAPMVVTVAAIGGFPIVLVLAWMLEQSNGRWFLDRGKQSGKMLSGLERNYLSIIVAYGLAAVGAMTYQLTVGFDMPGKPEMTVAGEDALLPVQDNSIAVLPFMPLDETEESRILSSGIAEDVISKLSRVPGLLVASRGDAFTLEPNSNSANVRKRLRVAMYVEGSVQFDGSAIRVVAQLIDSNTGFHLLSRDFDRDLDSYFEFRDEITSLIVSNLRPVLPPATRQAPVVATTDPNFDVYFMYRKGIDVSRSATSESRIEEALRWIDNALAVDPGFAAAHAGRCDAHVKAYVISKEAEHIDEAEASCARALTLNPNLDVVYGSLGELYSITGQFEKAESAYQSALAINPSNSIALMGLGEIYREIDRPADAEASLRQATGLHPGDWAPYNALGRFLFRSGRYDEAVEQYRKMLSLNSTSARGYRNLGTALSLSGHEEEAESAFRRALDLEPNSQTYDKLGLLLYSRGMFSEAVEMFERAIALRPRYLLLHSHLGDALNADGRSGLAAEAYRKAQELAIAALEVNPNDAFTQLDLAWICAALDDFDCASDLIESALASIPEDPFTHYTKALIDTRFGAVDEALRSLERAVSLGYATALLESDPNLAILRGEARWEQLVSGGKAGKDR
jgi:tetratricopeptide (TPR) repeat protein/TolB-like protein/DNA-binding winged helix-turn-helix (wHTH) protein